MKKIYESPEMLINALGGGDVLNNASLMFTKDFYDDEDWRSY